MSNDHLSLFYALGATLSFASASIVYAAYSKRVSVLWMNCFKSFVAFIALAITIPIFSGWHPPSSLALAGFILSGLIGLNIGDLFLLSAFTRLGVARTLILFGFQPLLVGVAAYFLFGQALNPQRFLAVIFLIACLFIFSFERYRTERRWEISGLFHALMGVVLDTCGILITRASFANSPSVTPLEGHFFRCFGALIGFAVLAQIKPIGLFKNFQVFPVKNRLILIAAALGGTYLSLFFYLTAVKIGNLASIAGIAITGPMFATLLELVVNRRAPNRYLIAAMACFSVGFYILIRNS
jgi:drug/metabolite transporter (DMT)-like permease